MADDINVKTSAKTVKNEKTSKQDEELAKAKKKKEEADLKAKEATEERIRKEEEAKKEAEEKAQKQKEAEEAQRLAEEQKNKENIANVAALAGTAIAAAAGTKKKGFFSGIIIGLIAGIVVSFLFNTWLSSQTISNPIEDAKDSIDQVITETFAGYTAADFKDAVLGEASQHQELIVMEQPLEIATTITKSGLGGWEIFSKTKDITYAGTGVYTVDLKDIDENHIDVNETDKIVTVSINHAVLQYVNIDYDNMKFEDTEKGLLSFGDITLTMEQQNELEKSVKASMEEVLLTDTLLNQADEFAKMKTWEIFQPLISAVSPEYRVEISFNS
ncbi:MAG: DUF4230 domain-containing protein [Erysipelotrichaceae bacterium]|nr:DUF4230 domain-containing protein [Erysipelotrichaceae bacterium]